MDLVVRFVQPVLEGLGYSRRLATHARYVPCISDEPRRFPDVVLYVGHQPVAAVECKRPRIPIGTTEMSQLSGYLSALNVRIGLLTNGDTMLVCRRERDNVAVVVELSRPQMCETHGWTLMHRYVSPFALSGMTSPDRFLDHWMTGPWHMTPLQYECAAAAIGTSEAATDMLRRVLGARDLVRETCAGAIAAALPALSTANDVELPQMICQVFQDARYDATRTTIWQAFHHSRRRKPLHDEMLRHVPRDPLALCSYAACVGYALRRVRISTATRHALTRILKGLASNGSFSTRHYAHAALRGHAYPLAGEILLGPSSSRGYADNLWDASFVSLIETLESPTIENGVMASCIDVLGDMLRATDSEYVEERLRLLPRRLECASRYWLSITEHT